MVDEMHSMLQAAIDLNDRALGHRVDKANLPYVDHPLRVMVRSIGRLDLLTNPRALVHEQLTYDELLIATTAVLHDVVEDSDYTLDDLRAMGFPKRVVDGVASVTHTAKEDYHAVSIPRAAADPIGRVVKLADILDNTDPERVAKLDKDAQDWFAKKYPPALQILIEAGAVIGRIVESIPSVRFSAGL